VELHKRFPIRCLQSQIFIAVPEDRCKIPKMPGDVYRPSVPAQRAIVTPRARQSPGGATLPLPALVAPILDKCHTGAIQIVGPPLSGKTTALSHLRAVSPTGDHIVFLDDPNFDHWMHASNMIAMAFDACIH